MVNIMGKRRVLLVTRDREMVLRMALGAIAADWSLEAVPDLIDGIERAQRPSDESGHVDMMVFDEGGYVNAAALSAGCANRPAGAGAPMIVLTDRQTTSDWRFEAMGSPCFLREGPL
jgi:hypothetical protein